MLVDDNFTPAVFSECRTWRYVLRRRWGSAPPIGFILLNPSTADETNDDPTIRRCIGFAKAWGYGGLVLGNIFAFRATEPKDMKAAADPVGPANDEWLDRIAQEARGEVVCGWGIHGEFQGRGRAVLDRLWKATTPEALSMTASGQPGHPLYLKATSERFVILRGMVQ